jgi:hypothetical protein
MLELGVGLIWRVDAADDPSPGKSPQEAQDHPLCSAALGQIVVSDHYTRCYRALTFLPNIAVGCS